MNAVRIAALLAILASNVAVDLAAQQTAPALKLGDRVRVLVPTTEEPYLGTIQALGSDTLLLAIEGDRDPLVLSLADMTSLELSRGVKSRWATGAALGAGTLGLIGFAVDCTTSDEESMVWGGGCGDGKYTLILGAAGAVIGGLIGSTVKVERWEEIPLDVLRIEASAVSPDGVSVSVSLRLQ